MPLEKEKQPLITRESPMNNPERRYETRPAGPVWTEKEIEEEKQRRKEDPNWFREPE